MKILHVIPSMNPSEGGVSQAVRTMVKGLIEKRVQNEVVTFDDPGALYLCNDPFIIYALGKKRGPWCYNSSFYPWLLTNLGDFNVVIVHALWSYPGYAIQKAMKKLAGRTHGKALPKLFVMPHGMLDPYFQRAPERKLKALRNYIYWELVEKKLINGADGILFTCEAEATLAKEPFWGYKPKKDIVIGMGISPPPPFKPEMKAAFIDKCPGLENESYLLFLSRIDEKKGVDLLLNAYLDALKKTAGTTVSLPRLVIAGPGIETHYGFRMQQLILENPELSNAVFLPGMLSGDAKWGAFYGCEAFILPSHQENFGIAVVEAMACGRAVLISDQVNIWEKISLGGGCFVAGDTLDGTCGLLDNWQQSSYLHKIQMGKNAYGSFKKWFSASTAANQLLKAIQES